MKRAYTKPELFCEEYELSVSIAGNCDQRFVGGKFSSSDPFTCGYYMGTETIFASKPACAITYGVDETDSTFCYQTSEDVPIVFAS